MKIKMILTNPFVADSRVYKEAKYYVSKGHEVEVLCWDREGRYAIEDEKDGIKIHRFHIKSVYGSGMRKQLPAYLKFRRACIKYLKMQEYDILHCHDLDGAIIGYGIKSSAKRVFDMHEYYIRYDNGMMNKVIGRLVQSIQNRFDWIIYLNNKQKRDIKERNIKKTIFLPNYPEKSVFYDIEKTQSDKIRVGFVGNIRHFKSSMNMIECCKKFQEIEMHFYGYGHIEDKLKKVSPRNVFFHGRYEYCEQNAIYKNIDIINCIEDTLKNDGYPIKFYDSLATKTGLIVDGNSERAHFVKDKGIGFLVDVNDIQTYYDVFSVIIKDIRGTLHKIEENYEKINESFFWDDIAKGLDLIEEKL